MSLAKIKKHEYFLFAVIYAFVGYGFYLYKTNLDAFLIFVEEDGIVENLTSLFLLGVSLVSIYRVFQYKRDKSPTLWIFTAVIMALLFFFAAGEEISWGQRIFGIQSSEFFLEHNKQAETNLHNLVVGDTSINKLIFSQILFIVMVIYFVFSRLLVQKVNFIGQLEGHFNVPLPRIQHVIVMLTTAVIITLIQDGKNAELLEMTFAFIFFMIFLNPAKIKH